MVFDEFKYKILNSAFNLAGMFIANQVTKTDYTEQEKMFDTYYKELKGVVSIKEKETKEQGTILLKQPVVMSITEPKIDRGTACLPCSKHHFSTASAMLNEAVRFAKEKDMGHEEIQRRIGIATDELNAAERGDLHTDQIEKLPPLEKEAADDALKMLRELRHDMDDIRTKEDLETVAAKAAKIRTHIMKTIWEISMTDGTIEKLCKDLKNEERERCIVTVNKILKDKGKSS